MIIYTHDSKKKILVILKEVQYVATAYGIMDLYNRTNCHWVTEFITDAEQKFGEKVHECSTSSVAHNHKYRY